MSELIFLKDAVIAEAKKDISRVFYGLEKIGIEQMAKKCNERRTELLNSWKEKSGDDKIADFGGNYTIALGKIEIEKLFKFFPLPSQLQVSFECLSTNEADCIHVPKDNPPYTQATIRMDIDKIKNAGKEFGKVFCHEILHVYGEGDYDLRINFVARDTLLKII